jgi:hypothetical protein
VKLYVCYGTFKHALRPGGLHPCGVAYRALKEAGHDPEVVKAYGLGVPGLDRLGRRNEVERVSGQRIVPVLVTDDGEVVNDSKRIIAWAEDNPATASDRA